MHIHQVLSFTALLIFVFGLISRVSERWTITGPMVFMMVGIAVSPFGLGFSRFIRRAIWSGWLPKSP